MIQTNIPIGSSISAIKAKVDLFDGSTLVKTCTCKDFLQDFTLYREGDTSKFFGFGVSHKMSASFIDLDRTLNVQKNNTLEISLGDGTYFDTPFPTMYVTEVEREEKSNTITCTVFDALYKASGHVISELNLEAPYTLRDLVIRCAELIELELVGVDDEAFNLSYSEGANFAGDETIRAVLDAIAEVTQTIYFVNHDNKLVFKRLDKDGDPVLVVTKRMYYELTTLTPRTLTTICHATELGENLYSGSETGVAQIMRDNPLLTTRADIGNILDTALARVVGLTITQLNCDWEGDHCLEVGDKIGVITENGEVVNTFILDDVLEYQGFINQITSWEFTQDETATVANPTSIGEKINQTIARVDKVNKEITLMTTDVSETKSELAELKLTTDDIILRVEKVEKQEIDLDISNDTNFIKLSERVGALEISDTEINASISNVETVVSGLEGTVSELGDTLRDEIADGDSALNGEIATVKQDVSALQIKAGEIEASISSLESSTASNLSDAVSGLTNDLDELEESLRAEYEAADEILNGEFTGEVTAVREEISSLSVKADGITASVSSLQKITEQTAESVETEIAALAKEVNLKVDSAAVSISIEKALSAGVDKVVTSAKEYTFDDTGLNISSSDSDFSTQITEDGMRIYKGNTEVLTADNAGVQARDLHARTFLIIGENSRLEDRGNRTACFWIGQAGG